MAWWWHRGVMAWLRQGGDKVGISPWFKTSQPTAPLWTISLVPDSGAFSISGLTTASFALLLHNLATGVETTGVGTFSNLTAAVTTTVNGQTVVLTPALIQYQVAQAEVVLGTYRVYVLATLAGGAVQPFQLQEDWQVVPI